MRIVRQCGSCSNPLPPNKVRCSNPNCADRLDADFFFSSLDDAKKDWLCYVVIRNEYFKNSINREGFIYDN